MKKRTRWMLIAAGVVAVLAVVLLLSSDAGLEVETARVTRGPLDVAVVEEGQTRVRERYVVAAPVTGRLARITVDEGDAVRAGRRPRPALSDARRPALARRHAGAGRRRRKRAAARPPPASAEARARAEQFEREAERSRTLAARQHPQPGGARTGRARRHLRPPAARRRACHTGRRRGRARRHARRPHRRDSPTPPPPIVAVRAPSAGRVLRVLEKSERVVPAGIPLVEIGDAAGLEVVVDVLSEDAVRIDTGRPRPHRGVGRRRRAPGTRSASSSPTPSPRSRRSASRSSA